MARIKQNEIAKPVALEDDWKDLQEKEDLSKDLSDGVVGRLDAALEVLSRASIDYRHRLEISTGAGKVQEDLELVEEALHEHITAGLRKSLAAIEHSQKTLNAALADAAALRTALSHLKAPPTAQPAEPTELSDEDIPF